MDGKANFPGTPDDDDFYSCGSLIVNPGCTFMGYSDIHYEGQVEEVLGGGFSTLTSDNLGLYQSTLSSKATCKNG